MSDHKGNSRLARVLRSDSYIMRGVHYCSFCTSPVGPYGDCEGDECNDRSSCRGCEKTMFLDHELELGWCEGCGCEECGGPGPLFHVTVAEFTSDQWGHAQSGTTETEWCAGCARKTL